MGRNGGLGGGWFIGSRSAVFRVGLYALILLGALPSCAGAQPDPFEKARQRDLKKLVAWARIEGLFLYDLKYLPKRHWLITAGHAIEVWDPDKLERLFVLARGTTHASLDFTPDEKLLAVGCWGREDQLQVYSLEERKLVRSFVGYKQGNVKQVVISRDGRFLAATAWDDTGRPGPPDNATRVWEWRTGKLVLDVKDRSKADNMHSHLAFNPVYPLLYEASRQELIVYNSDSWKEAMRIHAFRTLEGKVTEDPRTEASKNYRFQHLAVSPSGAVLAAFVVGPGSVLFFDARTLQFLRIVDRGPLGGPVMKVVFSCDGSHLATIYTRISAFETSTGKWQFTANEGPTLGTELPGLAFDRTGQFIFSGGGRAVAKWRFEKFPESQQTKTDKGQEKKR